MRPQAIQARLFMGMGVAVVVIGVGALLRNRGDRLEQVLLRALEAIVWAWGGCKVLGQRVLGWGRLYRWGNRGRGRRLGSQGRPVRRWDYCEVRRWGAIQKILIWSLSVMNKSFILYHFNSIRKLPPSVWRPIARRLTLVYYKGLWKSETK